MHVPGLKRLRSLLRQDTRTGSTAGLERRKGPETVSVTETITTTLAISVTVTEHQNVTVFTTILSTDTKTLTATVTQPVTHSKLIVVPSTVTTTFNPTLGRVPPELSPITTSQAPVSPKPTPSAAPAEHHLSKSVISAIVIAVIVFLALVSFGAFLGVRKWLRKYRSERVLRKKVQTEGNELPVYSTTDPLDDHKVDGSWR